MHYDMIEKSKLILHLLTEKGIHENYLKKVRYWQNDPNINPHPDSLADIAKKLELGKKINIRDKTIHEFVELLSQKHNKTKEELYKKLNRDSDGNLIFEAWDEIIQHLSDNSPEINKFLEKNEIKIRPPNYIDPLVEMAEFLNEKYTIFFLPFEQFPKIDRSKIFGIWNGWSLYNFFDFSESKSILGCYFVEAKISGSDDRLKIKEHIIFPKVTLKGSRLKLPAIGSRDNYYEGKGKFFHRNCMFNVKAIKSQVISAIHLAHFEAVYEDDLDDILKGLVSIEKKSKENFGVAKILLKRAKKVNNKFELLKNTLENFSLDHEIEKIKGKQSDLENYLKTKIKYRP